MPEDELIRIIATGGMIGVVAALIRALLVKQEPPQQRIRTFFAGVLSSVLLSYLLRESSLSNVYKEGLMTCSSAFISTVWPALERIFVKWVNKKGTDATT
jgi:LytS/YehU family sensor histidine kinase